MNHFCTYFDRSFLAQGLALAASLRKHEADSILWALCLDHESYATVAALALPGIQPVHLSELEAADPGLLRVRSGRSRVEYYFTLSPCWPLYLLRAKPWLERITYVDADTYWFGPPGPVLEGMGKASILVTEHRHPDYLRHHERFGRFNVGVLSFRNDPVGRACLEWWRERCLDWCEDRVDADRYADQRYLDQWPELFGSALHISRRPGLNLAPWNWTRHTYLWTDGQLLVDGQPLELFHFARFRPQRGTWLFHSGQLEYGVMPWRLRQYVYGEYWRALTAAYRLVRRLRPDFELPVSSARGWHRFLQSAVPRLLFGSDWLRVGPFFVSGRLGFGRHSGRALSFVRQTSLAWRKRFLVPAAMEAGATRLASAANSGGRRLLRTGRPV